MHSEYKSQLIREFRDQQIRFATQQVRVKQADRAEKLLSELKPERKYPFDFLYFRVTEHEPDVSNRQMILGADASHDLRLFVEDMSDSLNLRIEDAAETVHTVDELSKMFNVSTKTISRWRDEGLVSRRFLASGRKRVGFLHSSVERFVAANKDRVSRGHRFSQLQEEEKDAIIERARELASSGYGPSEIAKEISIELKRSAETIRYTLKNFDKKNPEQAVFPDHRPVLKEEDRRAMYNQYLRGTSVSVLAKRYRRTRSSIVRLLNEQRALKIMELPLEYMHNDDFKKKSMRDKILAPMPISATTPRRVSAPSGLPAYLAALYQVNLLSREQEYHLFRKMNYLKYFASELRKTLDVKQASSQLMDEIERLFEQAVEVKNRLIQANLRLVVSIAKKHMASTDDFFALISDGNISLFRAVEKFDYSRGNKFSTYATWSIMKNFARSIPVEYRHRERFRTTGEEVFLGHEDERANPLAAELAQESRKEQINRILDRLDEREQEIIIRRFGLNHSEEPLTLKEVGESLGVTKERIRQIEARALAKLRAAASAEKIDLPE